MNESYLCNTNILLYHRARSAQEHQQQTEMERQRHNARGLPETAATAASNSSNNLQDSQTQPSSATTTSAAGSSASSSATANRSSQANPNVMALQHNMTTAGSGPLPPGWGKYQLASVYMDCILHSYHRNAYNT